MRTMERVYRESYITLVAASSDSVTQGFLKPRPEPPNSYTIPFRLSATQFGSISINELDEKEYDESTEPINTRAWTLQESLLAPRYLIYSSHTLQYRCSAGVLNLGSSLHLVSYAEQPHYSESLSTLSVPACDAQGELKRWLRLVMVYSTRSASLACDKLNAISAIANQFFSFLGPGYFAGIWEFQILWQLTWISSSSWDAEAGNRRSRVYRAPTWSWASIDGVVSYGSHLLAEEDEEQIYRCEVLGCDVRVRVVELPFGEVDNGVLRVRGVLRRAWLRSEWRDVLWLDGEDESLDAAEALLLRGFEQGDMKQLQNDASSDGDVRSNVKGGLDEGGEWPPMLVFCLPIAVNSGNISMGLLLANSGKDLFKRVGSFEDALTKDFDHHPQCEIAIV
ncbi:hypothetical protein MMC16_004162 [Acarospora aff. strigata]|nr:hypothetical protein [Acarospora aff. strigata]